MDTDCKSMHCERNNSSDTQQHHDKLQAVAS